MIQRIYFRFPFVLGIRTGTGLPGISNTGATHSTKASNNRFNLPFFLLISYSLRIPLLAILEKSKEGVKEQFLVVQAEQR